MPFPAMLQCMALVRTDDSEEGPIVGVMNSSEISLLTRAAWRHIPEDGIIQLHFYSRICTRTKVRFIQVSQCLGADSG
jgi:hypothetical protein